MIWKSDMVLGVGSNLAVVIAALLLEAMSPVLAAALLELRTASPALKAASPALEAAPPALEVALRAALKAALEEAS